MNTSGKGKNLIVQNGGPLLHPQTILTVGSFERAMFKLFPEKDAEPWDRCGLLVGDRTTTLQGVAVALDVTVFAIEQAAKAGANVLLTHHPVALQPIAEFGPAKSPALNEGALVYAAIEQGVALMAFHTNLDRSPIAQTVLPKMLSLEFVDVLDKYEEGSKGAGLGQVCSVREVDAPLTLGKLAARCVSVFARQPRVWGDFTRSVERVVTATGSASDLIPLCLSKHVDCLICGEVKYHDALAASHAGLAIIDLGHDTSELPLCAILVRAAEKTGVISDNIFLIEQNANWTCPESTRV